MIATNNDTDYDLIIIGGLIGDNGRLDEYVKSWQRDTTMVGHFTHGLIKIFSNQACYAIPDLKQSTPCPRSSAFCSTVPWV